MRRITLHLTVILILIALLGGCVINRVNPEPQTIVLREDAGSTLRVEIEPGEQWSSRMQAEFFAMNRRSMQT